MGVSLREAKRAFDIHEVVRRIRQEVKQFADAAMFDLAEQGFATAFHQLAACIISVRTRDEVSLPAALRLFNAALSLIDGQGTPRPYLAEALPQLNSDSWRVFPDGRMETTYRLRENLTWQDGTPLTAENFVFAYRVYKDPALAIFIANPQDEIDAVTAPDPRTIVHRLL